MLAGRVRSPEPMRKQICESTKRFPPRRRSRQPAIESGIKYQSLIRLIAHRPKIANCVALQEGLRVVPYFAGQAESMRERMGNTQRLAKLRAAHRPLHQLVEKKVEVIVESLDVGAHQNQS